MQQLQKFQQIYQKHRNKIKITPYTKHDTKMFLTHLAGFTNHSKSLQNRHANKPVLVMMYLVKHHKLSTDSQFPTEKTLTQCNRISGAHWRNQEDSLLFLHLIQALIKQR